MNGRSKQRTQLRLEDARLRQPEPDTTQPRMSAALRLRKPASIERGVDQWPSELAFVDVERPDRHRTPLHPFYQLPVDVVLLVFSRHIGWPANEHEFGAI